MRDIEIKQTVIAYTSSGAVNSSSLGLPAWYRVWFWLSASSIPVFSNMTAQPQKPLKNPDIPVLTNYDCKPDETFWSKFPFRPLPSSPSTGISWQRLEQMVQARKSLLTIPEYLRALRAVSYLKEGAPSWQISDLPSMLCKNARSAFEYGVSLTDTVAEWVKAGFVAGPFDQPPFRNFRVNSLMMVPQKDKIRPILNVSSPEGYSLNDNVNPHGPEKVRMSSARQFGHSILDSGKNSLMSKFDMCNAYKNIPCRLKDLWLQGFRWCGKFFVDISQIFGAIAAVSNFDTVGHTVKSLAHTYSSIPRNLVHKQLDDVPLVAPKKSGWCQEFSSVYTSLCKSLNIQLASECPLKEKAFMNSTRGKVLGIEFDSEKLTWRLPEDKRVDYINSILTFIDNQEQNEKNTEEILGKLNFVSTMCPFMRTYKVNLKEYLKTIKLSESTSCPLPVECLSDLNVWLRFLQDNKNWVPICPKTCHPPLRHKTFTTDAAGWSADSLDSAVGFGCIGLGEEGEIVFANQSLWNLPGMGRSRDNKEKFLGNKTTSLEFSGILIPFLLEPELMKNQHILIQVDNIGCVFAWENGYSKQDNLASILVRVLVVLASRLNCIVHVHHHPRNTSWESRLADRLSRERTTTPQDKDLLRSFGKRNLPNSFKDWMSRPTEDWDLPIKILNDMSSSFFG